MKTIYLARPIDYTSAERAAELNETARLIRAAVRSTPGYALFDPAAAFEVGFSKAEDSVFILETNEAALVNADITIAIWPRGSSSWGVPAEIQQSISYGNQVYIVTTAPRTWAMPSDEDVVYCRADTMEAATEILFDKAGIRPHPPLVPKPEPKPEQYLCFAQVRQDEWYEEPTRGYATDAGIDLYISRDTHVPAHGFVDVPSNTAVSLPPGTWGYLTGRSSTLRKKGLLVNPGVIDYGYTGELFSGVQNMTGEWVNLKAGERIAQLIVLPMVTHEHKITTVDSIPDKERGSNGFGSSGS